MSQTETTQFLDRPDGQRIAYRATPGPKPGIVWLGGFKSDMVGSKASALHDWAQSEGHAFVRFDYLGHGESSGDFTDGTIGRWADDATHVLDALTEGKQILIGSSMGGWIALLLALARPDRVGALFLIAPAPDFTEDLMWAQLPDDVKARIEAGGVWERPSDYDEPYVITRELLFEAREHLLLKKPLPIACPVEILHGQEDPDVPWERSLTLADRLETDDVTVTFLKWGSHTLSDAPTLANLVDRFAAFARRVS